MFHNPDGTFAPVACQADDVGFSKSAIPSLTPHLGKPGDCLLRLNMLLFTLQCAEKRSTGYFENGIFVVHTVCSLKGSNAFSFSRGVL